MDHAAFRQLATQLREHADGYEQLGLTSDVAAAWANCGFTPGEVANWLWTGLSPAVAASYADRYLGPSDACRREGPASELEGWWRRIADGHRKQARAADTSAESEHWTREADRFDGLADLARTDPDRARQQYRPTRAWSEVS
jgi:hypothetical protein